ncbi:ABC-type transport system [Aquipluma nitroreducens]|uniref:ABC-type transport system n=1 Tax=Aquipluma nitroreducens TaxID=2010828 RepID=A0A5K7SCP1_9BACT|nr:FtsX-like permease family protein [Aquipluma nitroreducens]BBE19044.1 ABC-type transport system [Aquipluma nitroreducens]
MILAVAWRNIWRSKTRSLVILVAICLGLASGVFYMGFYQGMVDQRINTAIKTEASHIQIHHREYLNNPDKKFVIADADSVTKVIRSVSGVKATTSRIIMNTMIQSPTTSSGVKVTGVIPEDEKQVTNLYTRLIEGTYFEEGKRNPIVIGKKLAEKLKVKLKSKVVITLQDMQGNMTGAAFKVEGIFETSNTAFDESCVFVRNDDISRIMVMDPNSCHEIAVLLDNNEELALADQTIQSKLRGLDVKTWREIMPDVSLVESSFGLTMIIFMGVILLALLFGIINTMLMAVLERTKELGMLMAIGMNKFRVFMMILLETVMLSLVGGVCGIVLGWMLNLYFGVKGIDLGAWSTAYKSMGFDTLVYTKLSWSISFEIAVMVVVTGIIAAIYPAMKALKLKPAEAVRVDM